MKRARGFTLLELLAAVLIGSLVILMTTGGIQSAMNSWQKVQAKVGENYMRRNVLDLVRRQTSSIFLKQDAEQFATAPRFENQTRRIAPQTGMNGTAPQQTGNSARPAAHGFSLPAGTDFFRGNVQELSFLSTVSFLSDFPGQSAVRYYVVQGDPEGEAGDLGISSRSEEAAPVDPLDPQPQIGREEEADNQPLEADELEGNLYLVMEETNLFLSQSQDADTGSGDSGGGKPGDATAGIGKGDDGAQPEEEAEVLSRHRMTLLGPLRKFSIRYRKPAKRDAEEFDSEDNWSLTWDVNGADRYPTAVEFTLFYEKPGITDDILTEDLPGTRLVVPVFDPKNMIRGPQEGAPF